MRAPIPAAIAALLATIVVLAHAGERVRVDIDKFKFAPAEVTVPVGGTVVWINDDETPHTIATEDRAFVSKALDTGDRYEHTFDKEGDVVYLCGVHPFMTGIVHVRK